MFPNYPHQVATVTERRSRYEATARKHRLLHVDASPVARVASGLRRRRRGAADGSTSPVALPSDPLGRTPSGVDRQAA